MRGLLVLIIYAICVCMYCIVRIRIRTAYINKVYDYESIGSIILFSTAIALINYYVTVTGENLGSDRLNYLAAYSGTRTYTIGLDTVFNIFRHFNVSFSGVLAFITLITTIIILVSCRTLPIKDWKIVFFLLTTEIIFFSFTGLKQTFANAFSAAFFSVALSINKRHRYFLCIFFLVLACSFHLSGVVLLPILLKVILERENIAKMSNQLFSLIFIVLLFVILEFTPIGDSIIEGVYERADDIRVGVYNINFIKGAPMYFISIIGHFNSTKLKEKYEHFGTLMLSTDIASFLSLLSIVFYWAQRFSLLFCVPVSLLLTMIVRNTEDRGKAMVYWLVPLTMQIVLLVRWVLMTFYRYGGF